MIDINHFQFLLYNMNLGQIEYELLKKKNQ